MALSQWWILVAVVVAAALAVAAGLVWGRRTHGSPSGASVARAERLRALPSVRRAARRRAAALAGVLVLGGAAVVVAGVVAARPMSSQTVLPEEHSRDVMLCLDVSGSMSDVDVEILDTFADLTERFAGERIGLTVFNSSAVQSFPLTDDYEFARRNLASMRDSIASNDYQSVPEHWTGTLDGPGSSLIGDGLASCALRFDHDDEERSRSVILATDNEVVGEQVVTLQQAAALAGERGIRVFALNPIADDQSPLSVDLDEAAASTGGRAYALRGATTVADIVADVQKQEARALQGEAETVWSDDPTIWAVVLLVAALGTVVVVWRARA
ncbi:VWA domain-containing protein [Microbacterium indicum]|uniref:VWA domain-containing protein n=1 Tax=Microbacterium indicum TaxID=358100 RepID=UPI000409BFEF|nr:VWA domain-containing protein [Microbacterium indicum]